MARLVRTNYLPFCYRDFLFAPDETTQFAVIKSDEEFQKILESTGLNKNVVWLSENISNLGVDFFEFISKFVAFPKGKAGYELALKIHDYPLRTFFENEPVSVWNLILRVPVSFVETHLTIFKGSKLRELLILADEIWRRDQSLPSFPGSSFETLRANLKKIRFPLTSETDEKNRTRLKTLPAPWKAILSETGNEQTLELRAVIKDRVDLERARNLFTKNYEALEKILEDLT